MFSNLIQWISEIMLPNRQDRCLIGLCKLREAKDPVFDTRKVKTNDNYRLSDIIKSKDY